jgi:actin-like ATPase involved in cell morphogenesis
VIAAIDFGASATKAALLRGTGQAGTVLIDNGAESSSAVFLSRDGTLICGQAADNSSRNQPERAQAGLKRRINRADTVEPVHQDVEFNVTTLRPLVRCVATVIGHAWAAIRREAGDHPVSLVLTHPVGWAESQRAVLLEAAELVGVRVGGLLSEAEAVGWHVCTEHRPNGPLLVVDLGASTLDIAVLDVGRPGSVKVLHCDGDNNIGGDDFDLEIIGFVGRELSAQYELTEEPDDEALVDQFRNLCESRPHVAAREAERIKLALAAAAEDEESATFAHRGIAIGLTRRAFADSTQHLVDRIIRRVRDAISYGGVPPQTMVVSGGAALLPSIQEALADLAKSAQITLLDWAAAGLTGTVTTAVALGATRMPKPWPTARARAIRPVTLTASRIWPGARHLVAVPGGIVVLNPSLTGVDELVGEAQANPTGTTLLTMPAGITQLSYDPSGRQLVTASRTKTISTWRLDGLNETYPPLAHACVYWRGRPLPKQGPQPDGPAAPDGTVTAVAAHGPLVAWTESEGPGAIIRWKDWNPYRADFPVRWLAFTDVPQLLVVGDERLVLVDPATTAEIATLRLPGAQRNAKAGPGTAARPAVTVASDDALVFTASSASGKRLACYDTGDGRFDLKWHIDNYRVPMMTVGRLDGRTVLVVFDAGCRVYRALDARTGEQIALKDAGRTAEPTELLSAAHDGVVYARHAEGDLSVLAFAEAPR